MVITALPPEGRYRVQAELPGFASEVRENLTFNAGQRAVLNPLAPALHRAGDDSRATYRF